MTLRQIVAMFRQEGTHSVVYANRKDGGIDVISIDGEKFQKGTRAGNRRLRELAGERLSQRQTTQRQAISGKGSSASAIKRKTVASAKPKVKKISKSEAKMLKEYRQLRNKAKKKNLKPIGLRQIRKAMKRGEKWKDIKSRIKRTYISRITQISNPNLAESVAIYLRDKGLSSELADYIESHETMASDLQDLRASAYDAVQTGQPFNETYWLERMRQSHEEASKVKEETKAFIKEIKAI